MFLRAKVDSKTRQIVFIDNKDAVAGISGDYNVDGVIFILPENEDYFEFLNASAIRVIFFTPDGTSHNQVLTSRDEVYGMPKWTFDNNILSLDRTAYIKFFIILTKTNLSGQILQSWVSCTNSLLFLKNRDYDNQEEQAAMDTEIDRLAGLVTELTSKAASIGDVERLLETITGSSPQVVATVSDLATADPTKLYLVAADGKIYYYLNNQWNPGPVYGSYSLDSTLTQTGQAADAKVVGDRIGAVEEDLEDVKEDLSTIQIATSEDVGKALKVKTVANGKVTEWEFGADDSLNGAIVEEYSQTKTYAIGDICLHNGTLYACSITISVAEAWNETHWTVVSVGDIINDITTPTSTERALEYSVTDGKWMMANGNTNNVASFEFGQLSVLAGTQVKVTAAAGQSAPLWVLKDGNNSVAGYSSDTSTVGVKTETVNIAVDGTLYVNNKKEMASISVTVDGVTLSLDLSKGKYNDLTFEDIIANIPSEEFKNLAKSGSYSSYANDAEIAVTDGKFLNRSGNLSSSELWHLLSFAIPKNAVSLEVTAAAGQNAPLWTLKDASNNILWRSSDTSGVELKTETVDLSEYPGAVEIYVNDKKSNAYSIEYTLENVLALDLSKSVFGNLSFSQIYEQITNAAPAEVGGNILYGKTLCVVGDSITQGADIGSDGVTYNQSIDVYRVDYQTNPYQWVKRQSGQSRLMTYGYQIAERNHMTFYNGGISGGMMAKSETRHGFSNENGRYTQLPDDMDYLVIFFGWNDSAYGTLGTINDTTNETFYGGYNVVLPYIINKHADTRIIVVVPFGTTPEMRQAVRLIANKWGVACFDMYQGGTPLYYGKEESVGVDPAIVELNRSRYQASVAHPNYKGHTLIGRMLEHFMRGV